MGFSGYQIFLAVGMLVTGSLNTLTTKIADMEEAEGINGEVRIFEHPFVQAMGMFFGEFLCIVWAKLVAWRQRSNGEELPVRKPYSPVIFIIPALCDLAGTSLMYVGLTLTYASVFQMLRGAVVIFTGVLSVIFLKRKLYATHMLGMFFVLGGLAAVGIASLADKGGVGAKNPILGDIFVICAQVVVAVQMVYEEKYIAKYDVPALEAVGWEGAFGCCFMSIMLVIFYYIPGSSVDGRFEHTPDAIVQLKNNWIIAVATLGNVLSIAFFNFFGISVTKSMSATTRMVLDSVRTFVIWTVSLAAGWQSFSWLQVLGFHYLLLGTCVYNSLIKFPCVPTPPANEGHTAEEDDDLESSHKVVNGEPLLRDKKYVPSQATSINTDD